MKTVSYIKVHKSLNSKSRLLYARQLIFVISLVTCMYI